jgi:hypothetical protein
MSDYDENEQQEELDLSKVCVAAQDHDTVPYIRAERRSLN